MTAEFSPLCQPHSVAIAEIAGIVGKIRQQLQRISDRLGDTDLLYYARQLQELTDAHVRKMKVSDPMANPDMLLTKNENGRVVPKDPNHLPIFSHCCGGMIAVNPQHFYENKLAGIIENHGFMVAFMPESKEEL